MAGQRPTLRVVAVGKQRFQRHLETFGGAVPGFAVGEGELGGFDHRVHELRPVCCHLRQGYVAQQRQLLQHQWPLAPWAAFGDGIAVIVISRRRLDRSEEHTSELQSLMRISYAVFSLKTKTDNENEQKTT